MRPAQVGRLAITNQDFDLYVGRSSDGQLVSASTTLQNGTQTPTEEACFVNPTGVDDWFYAVVDRFAASTKPRLDMVVQGGFFVQYQTAAGSINELAASPEVLAVGAICWQSSALEPFSSRGPTIDSRIKPDISGQDGARAARTDLRAAAEGSSAHPLPRHTSLVRLHSCWGRTRAIRSPSFSRR